MDEAEKERWIVYSLLRPAARLGLAFSVTLRELAELLETVAFHEARNRGDSVQATSEALDISLRKAAQLSKALKTRFAQAVQTRSLARRIQFALWPGPLTESKLLQALPDEEPPDVRAALADLVARAEVAEIPGRTTTYALGRGEARLVDDAWLAKLDALDNLLGSVVNAVYGRFFRNEPRAFARTLTLRVRAQDLPRLRALYEEVIWEELRRLDADARGDPEAEELDVSIVWAPFRYLQRRGNEEEP